MLVFVDAIAAGPTSRGYLSGKTIAKESRDPALRTATIRAALAAAYAVDALDHRPAAPSEDSPHYFGPGGSGAASGTNIPAPSTMKDEKPPTEFDEPPWLGWFSCEDCNGWFNAEPVTYDSGAGVCDSCAGKRERAALVPPLRAAIGKWGASMFNDGGDLSPALPDNMATWSEQTRKSWGRVDALLRQIGDASK